METTPRVKGKFRKREKLNLLASSLSVKKEMKTSRENVVNRGQEGKFFERKKVLKHCCGKW